VKVVALDLGLEVFTPDQPRGEEFMDQLAGLAPDLSIVVAYGHILSREVLDAPRLGSINVHASLLPELRGAAPINWAIARGHRETGVTIMRMVEKMDAGPIIHVVKEPILPDETASELTGRLAELGAEALVEAVTLISAGVAEEEEQDETLATFAPKVGRETARIDWSLPAEQIARMTRAMDETPGAWSTLRGAPVKLFRPTPVVSLDEEGLGELGLPERTAALSSDGAPPFLPTPAEPGQVAGLDPARGVLVAAGQGGIFFAEVQPPGKRRINASDWINGRGVELGQRFE